MSRSVTGHVHHAALTLLQNELGLAVQVTSADAVRVVTRDRGISRGATVPPRLGQIGQLQRETQRERE